MKEIQFDATAHLLGLSAAEIRDVRDCRETSDEIGRQHVSHEGPCSVYIEEAICLFFGVEGVAEIKPAMMRKAREWLNSLPEKTYTVRLNFETYHDVHVKTRHQSQVRRAAIRKLEMTDDGRRAHHIDLASMREIS